MSANSKNLFVRLIEFAQKSIPMHVWIFSGIIVVAVIVGATGALTLKKSINGHKKKDVVVRSLPIAPKPEAAKPILPEPDVVPAENNVKPYEEALPEQVFEPQKPAPAPPPEIIKKSDPVIVAPELAGTWRKNAVQLAELPPGPRIAIIIDDAGLDRKRTAAATSLPGPLTIAFLTYAGALPKQVKAARQAGHEVMVHMAMEPLDKSVDPGPNVLQSDIEAAEILKRLTWGLDRFTGYVGINNHMGSRFTADPVGMNVVMRELKRRGLLFVDSRTSGQTVGASVALANDVPFTQRNIFLDNVPTVEAVNKQLRRMEIFAKRNNYAVAIGHPRDATIVALSQWLAVMAEKGFVLVPVSAIVAKQRGLSPLNLGR
ncbi:MAG: divergent polysaccharide deacetylase family protein [Rhodospirillaceae bacterium]|nr:divergent polysaccharide deacetylase family protein [Rhodospirillaceae bacterium]